MRYLRVRWIHGTDEEPVLMYLEVDDEGYETRKVEQYRNGHRDIAHRGGESGSTALSPEPLPSLEVINSQDEFEGEEIAAADFEEVWLEALRWFDEP